MRITNMVLHSSDLSEPINFSLSATDPSHHYIVRNIVGLDAEEITPKFYGFSSYTKSRYYNFSLKPRDIAFRVVLNPKFELGESYSEVRDRLYKTISATRTGVVNLQFNAAATTVAQLFGNIIKFESLYFDRVPEVQITVRCNDPIFRAINPVEVETEDFVTNPIYIYDSISTAPHGFMMQVAFSDPQDDFVMQDRSPNREWAFTVTPDGGFLMGDILHLSSEFSNKELYIERPGDPTIFIYLMDKISPTSIWPIIFPGENQFYFQDWANLDWQPPIVYYPAYWGV